MIAPAGRRPAHWRNIAEVVLSIWFLAAAALFAATTLCAIVNFGWRQPMFDQWREYEIFLGLPFPQSVLQLMNGHRPIVPNLIRVAEIDWFDANQALQIAFGSACAYASAALLALVAWRERQWPIALRCAGVMLAVLGVLWLGNARRLLHGSESLNGYVPTVFAILAVLLVDRASRDNSGKLTAAACVACVLATFSFGLGLASFCGALATGLVRRLSWKRMGAAALALLATLVVYVYVLPGDGGVREQVQVDPGAMLRILAQWTAGPWKGAWLDLDGVPPDPHGFVETQALLARAASVALASLGGTDATCLAIGIAGIVVYGVCVLRLLRRGSSAVTRLEAVAVGVAGYALASGGITVAARLSYLQHEHPDQIYADRYLVWPSLFWCALGLLLLARLAQVRSAAMRNAAASLLAVIPVLLLVTQDRQAIWGAVVARDAARNAAAVRSDVYDAAHFTGEALGDAAHLREIDLLRRHGLAMFDEPGWRRLGTRFTGTISPSADIAAEAHWLGPVDDPRRAAKALHVEGWVTHGIGKVRGHGELALIAQDGTIAGFAELSFISPVSKSLLLRLPSKRGFDGFVRDPAPDQSYTVALVDFAHDDATALATLTPYSPTSSGE